MQRRQVLGAVLASSLVLPASCNANSAKGDAQVEMEVRTYCFLQRLSEDKAMKAAVHVQ